MPCMPTRVDLPVELAGVLSHNNTLVQSNQRAFSSSSAAPGPSAPVHLVVASSSRSPVQQMSRGGRTGKPPLMQALSGLWQSEV